MSAHRDSLVLSRLSTGTWIDQTSLRREFEPFPGNRAGKVQSYTKRGEKSLVTDQLGLYISKMTVHEV